MTTISIIIPTYNAGQYIEEALASVFAQSFQDFEVIIIDDGSTDDTAQKVKALNDPRILYVYKENQGPAAARNHGLNLVRGEYIAFLDVDDLWQPHKLEMHLNLMRKSPLMGMSFSWFQILFDQPVQRFESPWFAPPKKQILRFADFLERNWTGHSSSVVLRTQCMTDCQGFDESFYTGEDYYLWLQIAQRGWEIGFLPEALSVYRRRTGSLTVDHLQIALDNLKIMEHLAAQVDSHHVSIVNSAVSLSWLDVAWSSLKMGHPADSWDAFKKGYRAIPQFAIERFARKFIAKTISLGPEAA
ncbi:MAG: glycosyltransferase family A protein [Gloeobacterales cyanobacterium]